MNQLASFIIYTQINNFQNRIFFNLYFMVILDREGFLSHRHDLCDPQASQAVFSRLWFINIK